MSDQTTPDPIPPDDPARALTVVRPDDLPHIGMVGDTYTILVHGSDTAGRFTLVDMHVPPGGGPGPHRHDFEETFSVLDGEIEATFRGETTTVRAGETINIPANAPHSFTNAADRPARLLCTCSPSGQDEFFEAVGVPVHGGRTTPRRRSTTPSRRRSSSGRGRSPRGTAPSCSLRDDLAPSRGYCPVAGAGQSAAGSAR